MTALAVVASPASADSPGPTDYESRVISISPSSESISVRFIGGDSFIELSVDAGHDVVVIGYNGEPYLHFDADGTVSENLISPSRFLNEDRFGSVTIPPEADAEADPQWQTVGSGGRYAWHDHRTHWMNDARPPAAEPGDQILEAVVPVVVDGEDISITVGSFLLAAPGIASTVALLAVAAAAFIGVLVARDRPPRVVALIAALIALALGILSHQSMPAETGPPRSLWLLPLVALIAAAAAFAVRFRTEAKSRFIRGALAFLVGTELLFWGITRRDAIQAAIIPSDAPPVLDRLGISFAAAAGAGLVISSMIELFTLPRSTPPSD